MDRDSAVGAEEAAEASAGDKAVVVSDRSVEVEVVEEADTVEEVEIGETVADTVVVVEVAEADTAAVEVEAVVEVDTVVVEAEEGEDTAEVVEVAADEAVTLSKPLPKSVPRREANDSPTGVEASQQTPIDVVSIDCRRGETTPGHLRYSCHYTVLCIITCSSARRGLMCRVVSRVGSRRRYARARIILAGEWRYMKLGGRPSFRLSTG